MSHVLTTEQADEDIVAIATYLAEKSIQAADQFIDLINEKFQALAESTGMGRLRDELSPGLRSFPVEKYVVFYRSIENGILVVRVIHSARDISKMF